MFGHDNERPQIERMTKQGALDSFDHLRPTTIAG